MSYFKSFTNLLYSNTTPTSILTPNETKEGAFEGMKEEDIADTASIFQDENSALKERLLQSNKENERLKERLTGTKSTNNQSYSSFIIDSLKSALELENSSENESKPNSFQSFLFNQLVFDEGLEEDDVYSFNHVSLNKEENMEHNQDIFALKQMIIERNYQRLLRNMASSKEINKLLPQSSTVHSKDKQQKDEPIARTTDFEVIMSKDYSASSDIPFTKSNYDSKENQKMSANKSNQKKKKKDEKENQANILSSKIYTIYSNRFAFKSKMILI